MRDGQTEGRDASEVGLALAFPGMLRERLRSMAAAWEPVEAASRRGWAGLEALRLETARRNGVAVAPSAVVRRVEGVGSGAMWGGEADSLVEADAVETVAILPSGSGTPVERMAAAPVEAPPGSEGPAALPLASAPVCVPMVEVPGRQAEWTRPDLERNGEGQGTAPVPGVSLAMVGREGAVVGLAVGGARQQSRGSVMWADVALALQEGAEAAADGRAGVATGEAGWTLSVPMAPVGRSRGGVAAGPGEAWRIREAQIAGNRMEERSPSVRPVGRARGGEDGREARVREIAAVHLDGRVVGQILSEHMARAASRPGAGTTFFDPRQGPAWTPSGTL